MADAWGASWGGTFVVWGASEQITAPSFGPPFIDAQCALRTTLGASTPLITALGLNAAISPTIERSNVFRSPRIDRALS